MCLIKEHGGFGVKTPVHTSPGIFLAGSNHTLPVGIKYDMQKKKKRNEP